MILHQNHELINYNSKGSLHSQFYERFQCFGEKMNILFGMISR